MKEVKWLIHGKGPTLLPQKKSAVHCIMKSRYTNPLVLSQLAI